MNKLVPTLFGVLLAVSAAAQVAAAPQLTAEQSAAFAGGRASFQAGRWAEALAQLKPLHDAFPDDKVIAKYTAEASIDTGDRTSARQILKLILAAAPDDWQALLLLARIDAEDHQDAARDATLQRLIAMHQGSADPNFRQLTQFIVERDALPSGHLDLYYSLQPWSRYNIYEMARIFDPAGGQILRITLESSDFDQPGWAKQHPDLAAKGGRMFSMDGYRDQPAASPGGQATQTHITYGFFDGRPAYNVARDRMVAAAVGKSAPISSTGGIVVKQ